MDIFDYAKARILAGKGSGGGGSDGNIVNPDLSGVIKFDLNSLVGDIKSSGYSSRFFKLTDEPFRINPDIPITLDRIASIKCNPNPWFYNEEEFNERKVDFETPIALDYNPNTYDGHEGMWAGPLDEWDEYIYRVTAETAEVRDGTTLSKGLYVYCSFAIPDTIEIKPFSLD
jgi:hypothetical protein